MKTAAATVLLAAVFGTIASATPIGNVAEIIERQAPANLPHIILTFHTGNPASTVILNWPVDNTFNNILDIANGNGVRHEDAQQSWTYITLGHRPGGWDISCEFNGADGSTHTTGNAPVDVGKVFRTTLIAPPTGFTGAKCSRVP